MDELEQHDCAWNDRLQDLLDADVRPTERAEIESHIATCPRCRLQYAKLKRLDAKLSAQIGAPRLDAAFDRQVFAKINALDARRREQLVRPRQTCRERHQTPLTSRPDRAIASGSPNPEERSSP